MSTRLVATVAGFARRHKGAAADCPTMYVRASIVLSPIVLALACRAAEPTPSEPPVTEPTRPPATTPERPIEPAAQPDTIPPNPAGLEWALKVEPSAFKLSDLKRVRVVLTVRNDGTETIAPFEFRPSDLRVDGEQSFALSLAFGNGMMPPRWSSLPAGQSATDERVGVAFVDTAGEHVISAHRGDEELASVTVTVR